MPARAYLEKRVLAFVLAVTLGLSGYAITSTLATDAPEYDLTIDNMPVNLTDNKTLYIDTQTNDRAYVIHTDYIQIRSQYLTFWDFNETYPHEDVNYVIGDYCYAHVPAENLTLDTVTEINRFQLSSWNGTVSVQCVSDDSERMVLEANSTDNATLLIRAVGLHRYYEYRILVDDSPVGWGVADVNGEFEFNYTAGWSNHTIEFRLMGYLSEVPSAYLTLIQLCLCLAVAMVVIKTMVLPLTDEKVRGRLTPHEMTKTLIQAGLYIMVATLFVLLVFRLFAGV